MVYISSGKGVFNSGGVTYQVKPGSLMLILPGIKHFYRPLPETGWREYWVGFKGTSFFSLIEERCFSPGHVYFEIGLRDSIFSLFNLIFDEVRTQRPLYQIKACAAILTIAADVLARERRNEQLTFYQQIVENAKYFMESNIFSAINLSAISKELGISTSRLNEIFKIHTSMTPYQYFIHIKIQRAESVLEHEDLSVKEVAYKMGFDDQYYFSRLFKSKTGVSPSDWKKLVFGK